MFFPLCAAALFFLSSTSLLDSAEGNNWPVARFTNGTVGLQNEGGKVMVNSNELHVIGDLIVKGQHLIPPKCMPPGGDKLQYNGTHWFCVCAENWSGETCETPPSPPPTPPPSPPPQPPSTQIPDASWRTFVKDCLDEAPVTGECTEWASGNDYGTMPNWDTSLVEDMRGYDEGYQGFGDKSTFNGDISRWNTEKVTTMYGMFIRASAFNQDIGSWNTEKVTTMEGMFYYASAFNQDIGSWNTAQVTNMSYVSYASAFNQDISSWTGSAATTAQTSMFLGATAFQAKFACTDAITGPASSCVPR